jgi:uncharacterized protein YmfQ (DUF2313 family)
MSICRTIPARNICPTQDESREQLLALLPRGRAWATPTNSVRWRFFHALAALIAFANARICALIEEFFCATHVETDDLWLATYGLPDACDVFPNLCAKVGAIGGATCADYQAVAAALGWSISCGAGCALDVGLIESGMTIGQAPTPATLFVVISLSGSSAYLGGQIFGPVVGFVETGMAPGCGPDISALDCVLQRIVHAHVAIVYTLTA